VKRDLLRVGHLYPSGGISDHEIQLMAPEGLRFHTTRLPFKKTGLDDDLHLFDQLEASAVLLAHADVDLIVVNCTAATMLVGPNAVNSRVFSATGIRCITTIEAVIAALHAASLKRVALLTPYPQEVVDEEIKFLASIGVEVVVTGGLPCSTPVEQGLIPPERWLDLGLDLASADVEGLLISCAGVHVSPVLEQLERHWGRPVISSNQALVWHVLNCLGTPVSVSGYGALLERRLDPGITL
jgi:maleate isomerase